MTKDSKIDIKKSLTELEKITVWFQDEDLDLDQGLDKLKEGVKLIKQCRERIKEIENEFIDIKKELYEEEVKDEIKRPAGLDFDDMESDELFDLDSLDLN